MSRIPMGVTVETLEEFEDKFSDRHYVYLMPEAPDYRQVDYLFGDTLRGSYRFHQVNWDFCLNTGYFETLSKEDGFILAKRREPDHPLGIQFSDQMKLLGYTIPLTTTLQGGVTLRPIVEWQAERVLTQTYRMSVELDDLAGHTWAAEDDEPDGGFTPTTGWLPGKPIGDQYALALPPTMPTGDYDLTLGVHDAAGTFLEAQDSAAHTLLKQVAIARIHIDKNKASFTANQLTIPVPMFVDMNEMRFLGFVPPRDTATPGDLLRVGLFWRARAKPQGDYAVAVQLRDPAGHVALEQAARPAQGTYPTTDWNAGEVLLDWHDFPISRDVVPGEYRVWVVLRDVVTGHTVGETQISQINVVKP